MEISVVVPVYNSQKTLDELVRRLNLALGLLKKKYEIILVNDGSSDDSWDVLKKLKKKKPRQVVIVNLLRNFGQHNALMCGFSLAKGNYIVTLDDDLQHPPEAVPTLYQEIIRTSRDAVIARYTHKKHNLFRNLGTRMVKFISRYTLGIPRNLVMTSFRIIKRTVVQEIINHKIPNPRIGLILFTITRNISNLETPHHARKHDRSGYSLISLVHSFLDNIINYSSLPLRVASFSGLFFSVISFFVSCWFLAMYMVQRISVSGFTTIVLLISFFSGLILFTLGIVGEYLIRIIHRSEYRPQYVVRDIH